MLKKNQTFRFWKRRKVAVLISNSIKIDNGLSEIIKDTINTINVDAINIKYLDFIKK